MPSFRGKPACSCLVAWLVVYERELKRRNVIRQSLDVFQLIGGYVKSGGTHATGGAYDIAQCDDVSLEVAAEMGAASWHRTPAQGFIHHQHGVLNGCPHAASSAKGQVADRIRHGNGLVGKHRARDPRPWPGRTWQEGIAWAAEQAGTQPPAIDRMDPKNYYIGVTGDHVLWLGQRLVAAGFGKDYTPTRTFTSADVRKVQAFQLAQHWTGADADGFPGKETLRRLEAA